MGLSVKNRRERTRANGKQAQIAADGSIQTEPDIIVMENPKEEDVPKAWVVVGELPKSMCVDITMQIQLHPDAQTAIASMTNTYVNTLCINNELLGWKTKTVTRSLEGLTWMDYDLDGLQNELQNGNGEDLTDIEKR